MLNSNSNISYSRHWREAYTFLWLTHWKIGLKFLGPKSLLPSLTLPLMTGLSLWEFGRLSNILLTFGEMQCYSLLLVLTLYLDTRISFSVSRTICVNITARTFHSFVIQSLTYLCIPLTCSIRHLNGSI